MKRDELTAKDDEFIMYVCDDFEKCDRETLVLLRTEIKRHNHLYYNAEPELSDDDYDCLYRYLQRLEARYPDMFDPDSPTQTVGAKV
jgi:DNA ligase (NAD+)